MQAFIYVCDNSEMSVYQQHNICMQYAKRQGYSVAGRVLDFDGSRFYEAINKVINNTDQQALIIYSKDTAFRNNDDFLFYKIYLQKLNKRLISCL